MKKEKPRAIGAGLFLYPNLVYVDKVFTGDILKTD